MRVLLRFIVWLLVYLLSSTAVFSLTIGGVAMLRGPASSQVAPAFDLGGVLSILSYGAFHWLLLAVVTFPIVAAPIVVWMILERRQRFQRLGVLEMMLLSLAIGSATALAQLSSLEYPILKATPWALFSSYTAASWVAFVLGLFIGRLAVGAARPNKGHALDALKDARK
jgi:hypothetical protein